MADFPVYKLPNPPVLTPFHPHSKGFHVQQNLMSSGGVTSGAVVANTAWIYSFMLTDWAIAYQLLWYVGATSGGNIDVGIYDAQKNRLVSAGSTAMSATTNTVQELNITDTVLPPGNYLLAGAGDNAGGTVFRNNLTDEVVLSYGPIYEQTGLTGPTLPDPLVPVMTTNATPVLMVIGIQLRSVF
jgi:hypothetical protein